MASPVVHIAGNQHYDCILCGRCCRRFQVLLKADEIERIKGLDWGEEPDVPEDFVSVLHGSTYFRRRSTGGCVFLDEGTGGCRMHARFGLAVKALTCRGYPHNVASTWPGEVSVIARMDCPAVRQNVGPPLTERRPQIERLVRELGTRGGFSRRDLQGLTRAAVEGMTAALVSLVSEADSLSPGRQAYAVFLAAERFEALGGSFLNDHITLRNVLPSVLERVREEAAKAVGKGLGPFSRALFREWLAAYCRRDEELVNPGIRVRVGRTLSLGGYLVGAGSLRAMGREHPDIGLGAARLFSGGTGWVPSSYESWDCWRRLLVSRLEAPQFFGVAYYDLPFFTGLRALTQTYALVLAAARCHAVARGVQGIGTPDVNYAVGAIDHCLGRSPLLQLRPWRLLEEHFSGRRYGRLLSALGWE